MLKQRRQRIRQEFHPKYGMLRRYGTCRMGLPGSGEISGVIAWAPTIRIVAATPEAKIATGGQDQIALVEDPAADCNGVGKQLQQRQCFPGPFLLQDLDLVP